MNKLNIMRALFLFVVSMTVFASCNKDSYLDGGVHDPTYDGTILEFLKSRPELFDSLVKIVEITEYDQLLDNPQSNITFYAATNQSIIKTVEQVNRQLFSRGQDTVLNMSQISKDVWHKYLSRYIFRDKYLLKDYPQIDTLDILTYPGQGYLTIEGEAVNIGTFYNDVKSKNSAGIEQTIKYAGYRQIVIDYSNPVATSDLQPINGAVHVLKFETHSFGFSSFEFSRDAVNEGITY